MSYDYTLQRVSFEKWPLREAKAVKGPVQSQLPPLMTTYDVIVRVDSWCDSPLRSHSASWRKVTRERLMRGMNGRARLELEGEDAAGGVPVKSAS
jgi:hypothetical protein